MTQNSDREWLEKRVELAHKHTFVASLLADRLGAYGDGEDLRQIAGELARLQESLLKGFRRGQRV